MRYTKEEIEVLKKEYPFKSNKQLAIELNKSYNSVTSKSYSLGLKKDPTYISEFVERLKKYGLSHQFKKGHIPLNKGKKISDYLSDEIIAKIKETSFKKGHTPHNEKPIGYITKRKDGYEYIKTESGKIMLLNRFIYESNFGKIPDGYNVVFKKDKPRICRIENLELVSNSENMLRNYIYRFPSEFIKEIRKVSKIKKIIKKLEK